MRPIVCLALAVAPAFACTSTITVFRSDDGAGATAPASATGAGGSGGAIGSNDSVTVASSSSGGEPKGACDKAASSCTQCVKSSCVQQYCEKAIAKCANNPDCAAYQGCIESCKDSNCLSACQSKHMAGAPDFYLMYRCWICEPGPCYVSCNGKKAC